MAPAEVAAWSIAGFLSGGALTGLGAPLCYFSFASAVWGGLAYLRHPGKFLLICIVCAVLIGGMYYRLFFDFRTKNRILPHNNEFSGVVSSEPRPTPSGLTAEFDLAPPERGRISVFLPPGRQIAYGDKLRISGRMLEPPTTRDLPIAIAKTATLIQSGVGNPLLASLFKFKEFNLGPVRRTLVGEEGAFLEGILLGYKNDFSTKLKEDMKRSGTTHLIAISGYNVSIMVLFLHTIILGLVSRRQTFYLVCGAILFFAVLVGAESSIVRAAIMGTLMLLAKEVGRLPSFGFTMLWTAAIMYLWNPGVLFNPGFLLSFASLLGITYFAPAIQRFCRLPVENKIAEYFTLTLSAQLTTLPFIILFFGQFSWIAVLTNLLILPLIPPLMALGFMLMGLNLIVPALAPPLIFLLRAMLVYILQAIHLTARISPWTLGFVPAWAVIIYALFITIFTIHYGARKNR